MNVPAESHNSPAPTRRTILAAGGVAAVSSFLDACLAKAPPFNSSCPASPLPAAVAGSPVLTIDAHCHIFNGTDIQAAQFLIKVEAKGAGGEAFKIAAKLLQDLNWSTAPSGHEELRVLRQLVKTKNQSGSQTTFKDHRNAAYLRARKAILDTKALTGAANSTAPLVTPAPPPPLRPNETARQPALTQQEVASKILSRLQAGSYDEYLQGTQSAPPPPPPSSSPAVAHAVSKASCVAGDASRSVDGIIDYIVHNFYYRYVMVEDYLRSFTYSTGRCVDLIVASMVDYDWWLSAGKRTKTRLKTQVEVMEQISILSRGQVHGLVPYDPFREVAFRAGKGHRHDSSLALVQDAITNRGCIGVKLYPPMGFAPLGNADLGNYWQGQGLPAWIDGGIVYKDKTSGTFGQRLDEALSALYQWCSDNEVPVMAHSSMSNGFATKFESLAGAKYWRQALTAFPKLRISFGHLGDFSDTLNQNTAPDASIFVSLMSNTAGQPGEHAFADTGYFSAIVDEQECMTERLKTFYAQVPAAGNAPLSQRLMYGTDWNLLISEGNIKDYFANFTQAFAEIDKPPTPEDPISASQRFFGFNAVDWLGLAGGKARDRLNAFYAKNGIDIVRDPPPWLSKLPKTKPATT